MRTLLVLALAAIAVAEERAFVETDTPRERYYVSEPVPVTLRVGIEREFLEKNVIQIFQRDLDFPVQVKAPWLTKLPGTIVRPPSGRGVSLAVNGKVVFGTRVADRGSFAVVEVRRTYLPILPATLELATPEVRYAFGTRFVDDFVSGRRALDRQEATAHGQVRTVRVLPLPDGRPAGYGGAVGAFVVAADANALEVDADEVFQLTLRITGNGNFEVFDTPRLDGLAGFHVYGVLDDKNPVERVVTYDLAALEGSITAVPPIAFAFLDPGSGTYRTVRTDPIPLTVRGGAAPPAADEPFPWLWVVVAAVALGAIHLWRRARARPPTPDAAAVFEHRIKQAGLADAFTEYIALRLGCATAAVISPDLAARLVAAGAPADLATRAAALIERLVAERYGGGAVDETTEARKLVAELEANLTRERPGGARPG